MILECPSCGYRDNSFNGKLKVTVKAKVGVAFDRNGNLKAGLSRRASMSEGELDEKPVVTCPNCGEEHNVMDIVRYTCGHCGKPIAGENYESRFCKAAITLRCSDCIPLRSCRHCSFRTACELFKEVVEKRG